MKKGKSHMSAVFNLIHELKNDFSEIFYKFDSVLGFDKFHTTIKGEDLEPIMKPAKLSWKNTLVVLIKSGVSYFTVKKMIKFNANEDTMSAHRGGGSILGETAFLKLLSLLAPSSRDNPDIISAALEQGDNRKVDLIVEDIYGSGVALEKSGLGKDMLASSFGKAAQWYFQNENEVKDEDKVRSLLNILAINIGQLSWLYSDMHSCDEILVLGNVLDFPGFNFILHVW